MGLKRPILVGGLGLSGTLWLLDTLNFNIFDGSTLLGAMAVGSGVWWWRQTFPAKSPLDLSPAPIVADAAAVDAALQKVSDLIDQLAIEAEQSPNSANKAQHTLAQAAFQQQLADLRTALNRPTLRVALMGEAYSGKSTLLQLLQRDPAMAAAQIQFEEIPLPQEGSAPALPPGHDGVLLLSDGDLTESTFTRLQEWLQAGQAAILIFNKVDQYSQADQQTILAQLQRYAATLPGTVPVVPTALAPRPLTVRRWQPDGQAEEWQEPLPADLGTLSQTLQTHLVERASALVLATTLRQAQALQTDVQTALNAMRRQRAMPLVEQFQWVAAAAAFANPVASLDMLATAAISAQLIMDLGAIYGFRLSLEDARAAAGALAALTVKLGLVEVSTQALSLVLKSHAATYVAGGLLQGLSAAYLTRTAGLSLIDHFETAALEGRSAHTLTWEGVAQRLQSLLQNRPTEMLQTLVTQGIARLRPTPDQPALVAADAASS